jgi:hypothetical protein
MPNTKTILTPWSETEKTVYAAITRDADGYYLQTALTSFAVGAQYCALTEDATRKGLYALATNGVAWNNGVYTVLVYKQFGAAPIPASDQIIGWGRMYIVADIEIVLDGSVSGNTALIGTPVAGSIALDIAANATAIGARPTNPLLSTDLRLNHLNADISAIPITPLLTGDARLPATVIAAKADIPTPPSSSDIATAVWGAGTRTLSSFGTLVADMAAAVWGAVSRSLTDKTGYYAIATNMVAAAPTVDQIDTQLSSTHGAGQWGAGVAGFYTISLAVVNADNDPVPDVTILLLNESMTLFLDEKTTDTEGLIASTSPTGSFSGDNGTYKALCRKAGYSFTNPITIVVDGTNVIQTITAVDYCPEVSTDPDTQVLSGTHDVGGRKVTARALPNQVAVSTTIDKSLPKDRLTDVTDSSTPHSWSLTLYRGVQYEISIEGWGDPIIITVTNDAGADFTTIYLNKIVD